MEDLKHTPGPWHIMKGGFGNKFPKNVNMHQIYATNDDLEMICKVWRDGMLCHKVQDFDANARLISAAPELLEILQEILKKVSLDSIGGNELYQKTLKVIDKATNQEPIK